MRMDFDDQFFVNGKRVHAQQAGNMGWGIFADAHFDTGDAIIRIKIGGDEHSEILPWEQQFGPYYDYCFTFAPRFVFCPKPTHPFRYLNHSCNANCGFINWGILEEDTYLPVVAYKPILPNTQVYLDYPLLTCPDEGTPEGDPWTMDCLCGEPNCRKTISGFDALPKAEQLTTLQRTIKGKSGVVLAHLLDGREDLLAEFAQQSPKLFAEFTQALQAQKDYARRLSSTRQL